MYTREGDRHGNSPLHLALLRALKASLSIGSKLYVLLLNTLLVLVSHVRFGIMMQLSVYTFTSALAARGMGNYK